MAQKIDDDRLDVLIDDLSKKEEDKKKNNVIEPDPDEISKTGKVGTRKMRRNIIEKILQPAYTSEIENTILWRNRWKTIGTTLIIISKLWILSATILSGYATFADTNNKTFSLLAAISSSLTLLFTQYGEFALTESSKKTKAANEILGAIGIESMPDTADNELKENSMNLQKD
jgi:hypothetical protein